MFRNTGANEFAKNQMRLAYEDKRDLYCTLITVQLFHMIYIYIFKSPCFYHPSENITYNISHNTHSVPILQIRPLVSRAQARLILRQSCPPHPGQTVWIGQPIRGPGFPVPGEYADERTNRRPDSGAHVNCLTSSVASCRISRRPSQQVTQH